MARPTRLGQAPGIEKCPVSCWTQLCHPIDRLNFYQVVEHAHDYDHDYDHCTMMRTERCTCSLEALATARKIFHSQGFSYLPCCFFLQALAVDCCWRSYISSTVKQWKQCEFTAPAMGSPWCFATFLGFCGRRCTVTGRRPPPLFWGDARGCWSICCISQDIFTGPRFWPLGIASGSGGLCRLWSLGASGESGRARLRGKGKMAQSRGPPKSKEGYLKSLKSILPLSPNLCMLITSYNQFQTNLDGWRVFRSQRSTEELSLPIALMLSSKDYYQYSGMVVCPEIGNPQPSLALCGLWWTMMDFWVPFLGKPAFLGLQSRHSPYRIPSENTRPLIDHRSNGSCEDHAPFRFPFSCAYPWLIYS
jgi:hypothetical protein